MVEILSGATAARSIAQPVPAPSNQALGFGAVAAAKPIQSDFYLSPVIRFDSEALKVIFEVRDSQSGEVKRQFPPERVVQELQKTAGLGIEIPEPRESTATDGAAVQGSAGNSESETEFSAETEVDVLI
ncbi:hypothetical protein [Nisaea sediminum]|uniref:hypothetical protein n=1 Tax=Nisaea sediminum TaxID=2775867 RepID=UPI0018692B41|nr:hypothetical protein [Nisaea sediminum]